MPGKRWSKDQDAALLDGVGVFSLAWFRRRAGTSNDYPNAPARSRFAIYRRAEHLIGGGGLTRGTYTLTGAAERTGYTKLQIQRAQAALHQKWKRLSPRGPYMITFDQLDEIVAWLRADYWCAKLRLYGCVNCGDNHIPSRGMGLCDRCYWRIRRLLVASGWPTKLSELRLQLQAMDGLTAEVRVYLDQARRHVERGWAMTETQIRALTGRIPRSIL